MPTTPASPIRIGLGAALGLLGLAVVGPALWRLLTGLGFESFWQDEIFSMRLMQQPTLGSMVHLALRDTHPPTYYALLYGWTTLFGQGEVAARLPSVLCAAAALGVLALMVRPALGWTGRLAAVAMAVTSWVWIEHAQEVRSYALMMLLVAVAAATSSRIVAADHGRMPPRLVRALFAAAVLLATASHLYGFFVGAWLCAALYLSTADRAARRLAVVTLAVAIALTAAYAVNVFRNVNLEVAGTMFLTGPAFLARSAYTGLRGAGPLPLLLLLGAAGLVTLWLTLRSTGPRALLAPPALLPRPALMARHDLLLAVAPVAVAIAGIAATLTIVHSFTYRGIQVAAPVAWVAMAALVDRAERAFPVATRLGMATCLAPLAIASLVAAVQPRLPMNPDFRGASAFIRTFPACHGQVIPVLRDASEQKPDLTEEDLTTKSVFMQDRYGFYAQADRTIFVELPVGPAGLQPGPALGALLARRLTGADRCPVLGWLASTPPHDAPGTQAAFRALATRLGVNPASVRTTAFVRYQHGAANAPIRDFAVIWRAAPPVAAP